MVVWADSNSKTALARRLGVFFGATRITGPARSVRVREANNTEPTPNIQDPRPKTQDPRAKAQDACAAVQQTLCVCEAGLDPVANVLALVTVGFEPWHVGL